MLGAEQEFPVARDLTGRSGRPSSSAIASTTRETSGKPASSGTAPILVSVLTGLPRPSVRLPPGWAAAHEGLSSPCPLEGASSSSATPPLPRKPAWLSEKPWRMAVSPPSATPPRSSAAWRRGESVAEAVSPLILAGLLALRSRGGVAERRRGAAQQGVLEGLLDELRECFHRRKRGLGLFRKRIALRELRPLLVLRVVDRVPPAIASHTRARGSVVDLELVPERAVGDAGLALRRQRRDGLPDVLRGARPTA